MVKGVTCHENGFEPVGEPPGETPIFLLRINIVISDLVISNFGSLSGQPGVMLVSDGSPLLAQGISRSTDFPVAEETGGLQDLTSLLGGDAVGLRVQVQSDVGPPERNRSLDAPARRPPSLNDEPQERERSGLRYHPRTRQQKRRKAETSETVSEAE